MASSHFSPLTSRTRLRCLRDYNPKNIRSVKPIWVSAGTRTQKTSSHAPGWQEVGPDVDRLVGHLEAAEDAVQRRALRMAVAGDDAVLPEHLNTKQTVIQVYKLLILRLFIIHQEMKKRQNMQHLTAHKKSLLYKSLKFTFFFCSFSVFRVFNAGHLRRMRFRNLITIFLLWI